MIKAITVTNFLGESLRLVLADPSSSGFAITSIDGLGPGKATVNINDYAMMDGGRYSSAKLPSRNIVINVQFVDNYTDEPVEKLRLKLYKYFPLKKQLTLQIETDRREAEITGYVESNEPDIFSSKEGSAISIICPDPYFHSYGDGGLATTVFSGIAPRFEFPFSNESIDEDLIILSSIENVKENEVLYDGDADVGVTIAIHAVGPAKNIKIYNTGTNECIALDIELAVGDDLVMCTERGKKSIYRIRDGVYTNVINSLSLSSDWFRLSKGSNMFAYTADEGADNLQFKIENRVAYEGV